MLWMVGVRWCQTSLNGTSFPITAPASLGEIPKTMQFASASGANSQAPPKAVAMGFRKLRRRVDVWVPQLLQ